MREKEFIVVSAEEMRRLYTERDHLRDEVRRLKELEELRKRKTPLSATSDDEEFEYGALPALGRPLSL